MRYSKDISRGAEYIDTRDLKEELDMYESDLRDFLEENPDATEEDFDTEGFYDLDLIGFAMDARDQVEDFNFGETLICEHNFTAYAQQLAEDVGAIDRSYSWPCCHIDWEAAATSLKQDYSELDY